MFFQRATAHALSRWRFYGPVASITLLALVAAILLLANHVASTTPDGTWLWQSSDNAQALYLDINGQSGEASYVTYDQVANRANPTNDTLVVTPDRELEFDMQGFPACGTGCPYALRNGLLVLAVIGSPSMTLRPATQSQFDGVVADLQSKVHSTTAAAQQAQQTVQNTQQNEQNLCVGKYGGELAVDQPVCSINIDGGTWTVVFDSTGHPTTDPCADDHWATAHGMASGTFTPGAYNEGCQLPTLSVDQAQSDCTSGTYFPAEIAPPFGGKATTYGPLHLACRSLSVHGSSRRELSKPTNTSQDGGGAPHGGMTGHPGREVASGALWGDDIRLLWFAHFSTTFSLDPQLQIRHCSDL